MKLKRRVAVVYQRSPLPIRSGADWRVAELIDQLASHCSFTAFLVLDYPSLEIRRFCAQRGIKLNFLPSRPLWHNRIIKTKHKIDRVFNRLHLPNPLNFFRKFYFRFLNYQHSSNDTHADPFWSICSGSVAQNIAMFARKQQIDVLIVEYIWLTACLRHLPAGVLKIVDTHDVMHLRKRAFAEQGCPDAEFGLVGRQQEREALEKFDGIIAIQAKESMTFREMLPNKPVITVPSGGNISFLNSHQTKILSKNDSKAKNRVQKLCGKRFLFLGGAHIGNVLALRHLIEYIWPRVQASKEAIPANLIIAGDVGQRIHFNNSLLSRVLILGYVDQTDWLYNAVDVVVNPVFTGSGLKIKTVEALAHGKLIITTPTGIEGISPPANNCCLIAQTPEQFSDLILDILTGKIDNSRIIENLANYVDRYLSPEVQYNELFDFLGL
jgi:glycosyltransferase involved in cell wall biosynthesis